MVLLHQNFLSPQGSSGSTLQYAAFFADCEHELSPVTAGMRLVLVYNLVWVGVPAAAPRLTGRSQAEGLLQEALDQWEEDIAAGAEQKRVAFLLGRGEVDGRDRGTDPQHSRGRAH